MCFPETGFGKHTTMLQYPHPPTTKKNRETRGEKGKKGGNTQLRPTRVSVDA
jgi:ribosomal protein L16/L10AE